MNMKPTLINPPPSVRSFDNYYWQHQNQLQPSALTFQALVQDEKSHVGPNAEALVGFESQRLNNTGKNAPLTTTLILTIESHRPAAIIPRPFDVESLINGMSKPLNPQAIPLEPSVSLPVVNPTKVMVNSSVVTPTTLSSFKNHHVFINKQCIELTLNTRALSSREAKTLQRTIKQWLVQNGYALKTLIINGVQQ
ncbi:MAG TPA: hypothetical protein DDY37_05960 [Legionella sp.]|nr:hypothetical protein [Legionella sp.]